MRPRKEDTQHAAASIGELGFSANHYQCVGMDVLDWWVCLEYRSHLGAMLLLPDWESAASRRIKSIARRFGMTLPVDPDGDGVPPPPGTPLDTKPLVVSIGRSTFQFPAYWKTVPHWQRLIQSMQGKASAADYEELMAALDARGAETAPRLIARDPVIEAGRDCLHRELNKVSPSLHMIQKTKQCGGSIASARTPAVRQLLADPLLPALRQEVRTAMANAMSEKCVRDSPEDKSNSWQRARLEVDLRAGDEVLKEAFRRWLVAVRQRYEREGFTAAPARRAPLKRWSEYRILGYIDLEFASHALDLSLSDSKIGQLIFPDPNKLGGKEDDPRRLRRTVRELAMDVMTYATLVELGYEVQAFVAELR